MKTIIGVYETHEQAAEALIELKEAGYPTKNVSIISHTEHLNSVERLKESKAISNRETMGMVIGAAIGSVIGFLTGDGIIAIPGLGFLFNTGAIAGIIAGFTIGLLAGTIISALSITGRKQQHHEKYGPHIKEGHFLLLMDGKQEEATHAKEILHEHGQHAGLQVH